MDNYNDPFDSATHATTKTGNGEIFGEVMVAASYCILEKGIGKIPFDPQKHSLDKRCTLVKVEIVPLPEHNFRFTTLREIIAESKDWEKVTWASARGLGLGNARELNGKWAKIKLEPVGKYIKDGQEKELTAIKFLALYNTEQECRAAYTTTSPSTGSGQGSEQGSDQAGEKAAALKFAEVIVQNAARGQTDPVNVANAVAVQIANMPIVNKYYGLSSPEITDLIVKNMAPF